MDKLISHLELHLSRINSRVFYINSGGCGIFALCLRKALNELGIDSTIHIVTNADIDAFNENIMENEMLCMDLMGWAHIVLKVGDYLIDSGGVYNGLDGADKFMGWNYELSCGISVEYLEEMIDTLRWNKLFDREDRELIEEMLCEFVDDYRIIHPMLITTE